MGDTANNEAKIVITTDPAQFTKFMVDAARAFRDLEKEGKGAARGIDASLGNLAGKAKQLAADAAKAVLGPAMDPARQAMAQALENARTWRAESTRIMGATGGDWKAIGAQIDDLSKRTVRLPRDVVNYADAVRELNGSWKAATEGAQDYSDLARYLGRESLAQMAPLETTMDQMFGVSGTGKVKAFFDAAVLGAQKLGQDGEKTIRSFEHLSPMLGMQTKAGAQGEKFGREAAALLPALQKQGLSPEQSEAAVAQLSAYFQGDLGGLTRQLRSAGIIGKKDRLTDEYGRLKNTLPEMLGMLNQLAVKHNKGLGGDQDMLLKLLGQNFPALLGGAVFHAPEIQKDVQTALVAGRSPSAASPIGKTAESLAATPEMQRQINDIIAQANARRVVGDMQLSVQDAGAAVAAGGPSGPPGAPSSKGQFASMVRDYSPYAIPIPGLGTAAASAHVIAGMAAGVDAEVQAGRSPTRQGKGLDVPTGSVRSGEFLEGFKNLFSRESQKSQAKETADALANKVLVVRMLPEMSGGTGGGRQVQ